MKKILKALALFLSWLTLSPLLLILDGRWKLLPKWLRIVLFVLSPLMVIVIGLALFFSDAVVVDHFHRYYYTKPSALQRITGVHFPDYKIVDCTKGSWFGHGTHHYDTTLEFEEIPDDAFYKALEKHGVNYIGENDTVRTFSFKQPYKYFSISYAFSYDLLTRGDVLVEVKEGSKTFKITMLEWPDNNKFFEEE